jgi:hypothetical protein
MSYEKALEAAGATLHAFESFGSYQGDWWADVTHNGVRGFVHGSFGSCSHCDAFEAEFDHGERDACDVHRYDSKPECLGCRERKAEYDKKLADFGAGYLDNVMTAEDAIKSASEYIEWDSEAPAVVAWLQKQGSQKDPGETNG